MINLRLSNKYDISFFLGAVSLTLRVLCILHSVQKQYVGSLGA